MSEALIVVPTYLAARGDELVLLELLESLRVTEPDAHVLLVDDASPAPELVDFIEGESSRLRFEVERKPENTGFSSTVNVGLRRALEDGRDAVLVNADVSFIRDGWLDLMRGQPRSDGSGLADVVGGLLLYPNGLIQHAGIFFSLLHRTFGHIYQFAPGNLHEAQYARRCPVTGALQFIRHATLLRIGVYDERFQMGYEDVDFCIRTFLAHGECVMQPLVTAYHHESLFRGRPSRKVADWQRRSWIAFIEKYAKQSFSEWVPSVV